MKTIVVLMCLIALGGCKKEENKSEENSIPYMEVRFYGNWSKFQGDILYFKNAFENDSVDKINWKEMSKVDPYDKPIYVDEGYKLPYITKSPYHVAVTIKHGSKYNMEEGEWVYFEIYSNGVRVGKSDTVTKYNPGFYLSK